MFGGRNPYYEAEQGQNVWEYYFERVGISVDRLSELAKTGQVFTVATASDLMRLFRWEPESLFMNPFGYFRSVENMADGAYPDDWWQSQRTKARPFLDDGTVRFKGHLLDQATRFAERNFLGETLGLQLRGSDKFDFGVGPNLSRKIPPQEYFPYIDRYLSEHPQCARIFVATDQRQWLTVLEKEYPGKVLSFSKQSLSDTNENRFHDDYEKAARGAEALVDALLLSKCNFLLKCHAAVGELALILNPDLQFLDLNYDNRRFLSKPTILEPFLQHVIKKFCLHWRSFSESTHSLSKVTSIEGDRISVKYDRWFGALTFMGRRLVSAMFRYSLAALAKHCYVYERLDSHSGRRLDGGIAGRNIDARRS